MEIKYCSSLTGFYIYVSIMVLDIRNTIGFCEKKGVDDVEVVNMIDDYLGRVFFCECELVNDLEIWV